MTFHQKGSIRYSSSNNNNNSNNNKRRDIRFFYFQSIEMHSIKFELSKKTKTITIITIAIAITIIEISAMQMQNNKKAIIMTMRTAIIITKTIMETKAIAIAK